MDNLTGCREVATANTQRYFREEQRPQGESPGAPAQFGDFEPGV